MLYFPLYKKWGEEGEKPIIENFNCDILYKVQG